MPDEMPGEMPGEMDAWVVHAPGPIETRPLRRISREVPRPGPDELLVRVLELRCRSPPHLRCLAAITVLL